MHPEQKDEQTLQAGGHTPPEPLNVASNQHAADVVREQINQIYTNDQPAQENPYQRTHQENFDWRTYHSAWQDYYKEYYRRYYSQITPQPAVPAEAPAPEPTVASLKSDIRAKVTERAQKFKKSHHFIPIVSALGVGLLFLLIQFNGILFAQVRAYVSPGELEGKSIVVTDPTTSLAVGPEPRLIIPKINVDVPVDYDVTALDDATVQVSLKDAIVHYKVPGADSLPGQNGNALFLGHSSNDVFAGGDYKFALVLADRLEPGDTYYLHYNSVRYTYKVTEKKIINPDQVDQLITPRDKPMATLITCTPPGTALKRLLVFAEQISPDPASATAAPTEEQVPSTDQIPGNSPTLVERILDIFF